MSLAPLPYGRVNLQQAREQLDAHGACWLSGVDASTPESILYWAEQLGSWELGIDEELLGPRVMHMRLDQDKLPLANQPAYFTADEFPLHTDVSYVPNPPGLMLMHCVKPDEAGGGQVRLARCSAALQLLPESVVNCLQQPVFRFQ
ncbi:MAG TPA: TauD/TfdA family dioxygenase, partial [Xanthomonadales bacterium]|nr:TauD/TfdA family dioxygenase [Xanthomonadales bacterium]